MGYSPMVSLATSRDAPRQSLRRKLWRKLVIEAPLPPGVEEPKQPYPEPKRTTKPLAPPSGGVRPEPIGKLNPEVQEKIEELRRLLADRGHQNWYQSTAYHATNWGQGPFGDEDRE